MTKYIILTSKYRLKCNKTQIRASGLKPVFSKRNYCITRCAKVHRKRMTEEIGNYRGSTLITVPEQESPEFLTRFCLLNLALACWLNKGMKRRDRRRSL